MGIPILAVVRKYTFPVAGAPNLKGTVRDLIGLTASYDPSSRYGLQSPFSYSLAPQWKGGRWRVDANYDTLLATGNAGTQPTSATVILYYGGGKGKYELPEHRLAPGEPLWVDVGQLIRKRVPDKNGRTLPLDATSGTFEFREKDAASEGHLYEGRLMIDRTLGHAVYACAHCCYLSSTDSYIDDISGAHPFTAPATAWGLNCCDGYLEDLTPIIFDWFMLDEFIAEVDNGGVVTSVNPGLTFLNGSWRSHACTGDPRLGCRNRFTRDVSGPVTVKPTVNIQGNLGYLYIGHDAQVTQHFNALFAQGAPGGGQYSWSSPDGGISFDDSNAPTVHITATGYTGHVNDTQITVNYRVNDQPASPASVHVTKRLFKYLVQSGSTSTRSPSGSECEDPNSCYGYIGTVQYNVYTQPNSQLVAPGGLNGTYVAESVSFLYFRIDGVDTNPIGRLHTQDGALDDNSMVRDNPGITGTSLLPAGMDYALSQDLAVGGFFVRNNTLHLSTANFEVVSNGPSN